MKIPALLYHPPLLLAIVLALTASWSWPVLADTGDEAVQTAPVAMVQHGRMEMPAAHFLRPVVQPGMHKAAAATGGEPVIPIGREVPLVSSMHMNAGRPVATQ